jgi:hypothetical protein
MVKRACLGLEDALKEGDENEVYICGVAWQQVFEVEPLYLYTHLRYTRLLL